MKLKFARTAGFAIFVISLVLPAVRTAGGTGDALLGGLCAWLASVVFLKALISSLGHTTRIEEILLPISGLVNYLFLSVCILSFWPRLRRTRIILEALMLPCFAATWTIFVISKLMPLIGHFFWIAACVAVSLPDVLSLSRSGDHGAVTASERASVSAG